MLCGEIFDIACALIMEDRESAAGSVFEGYAVGIINGFLCENREAAILLGGSFESIPSVSALTDTFPYSDRLISPCVYYLASRMIRDENADAAKELMTRCDRQTAGIGAASEGSSGTDSGGGCDCSGGVDSGSEELQVFPGSTVDVYAGVN